MAKKEEGQQMEEKQKEFQQKYAEYQMIEQQMKQLQAHLQAIEEKMAELTSVQESLAELKEVKENTEMLIPVSGGVFAKAAMKDNKNLIVNVGSNTAVERTIPEVIEMLGKQGEEIIKVQEQLTEQMQAFAVKAVSLQEEINKILLEK